MLDNTAKSATEWVFVARSMAQMPGGETQALRCMARAGLAAQDVADWLAVAEAWAQDFGDEEMARQCLVKAEEIAAEEDDWLVISKAWRLTLNDSHSAISCIRDTVPDWIAIAKSWVQDSTDAEMARLCLERAEDEAEDTDAWIRMAVLWKNLLQNTNEAIRCLERAEDVADYFEDYSALEETWRENFQEVDRNIVNNAIQRLVDAADTEFDLTEIMDSALGNRGSNQASLASETEVTKADDAPVGITDLGYLMPGAIFAQTGIWNSECYSVHRPDRYARHYAFRMAMPLEVRIDLSSDIHAYLYLLDADGNVLEENDDWQDGTDSRISRHLAVGTYTIEATTFDKEESGEFSLAINT